MALRVAFFYTLTPLGINMQDSTQRLVTPAEVQRLRGELGEKEFLRQYTEIPDEDLERIRAMPRKERRAGLAKQRKAARKLSGGT